ncbi:unnamed protein product [Urochloa humidicola]
MDKEQRYKLHRELVLGAVDTSTPPCETEKPNPPAAAADERATGTAARTKRRARLQKEAPLHCPRCNSTNTKFSYYNNYSLLILQRYFCKTCRRYWTESGSLRNVGSGAVMVPTGSGTGTGMGLERSSTCADPGSMSMVVATTGAAGVSVLSVMGILRSTGGYAPISCPSRT